MNAHRQLVHFLDGDTRRPLCGGSGKVGTKAAVHGVQVCATCAKLMTEQVDRASSAGVVVDESPKHA